MECPRCRAELVPRILKGTLELDSCPECKGVWLDDGELSRLTRNRKGARFLVKVIEREGKPGGPTCPRCSRSMYTASTRSVPVVLEGCSACHGLWFEEGELAETLAALVTRFTPAKRDAYDRCLRTLANANIVIGTVVGIQLIAIAVGFAGSTWVATSIISQLILVVAAMILAMWYSGVAERLEYLPPKCQSCHRESAAWKIVVHRSENSSYEEPTCPHCGASAPHFTAHGMSKSFIGVTVALLVASIIFLSSWY